jgi:hypothetical protein
MTNDGTLSERTPGLQFVWWETNVGEEAETWWGQLAGSTHRLRIVADQLEMLASKRSIDLALTELAYHLENYVVRIYELRERVLGLLIAVTHDTASVRALKSPKGRQKALMALHKQVPMLMAPLEALLTLLDEEINIRNTHTHGQFLNVVLDTGYDIFDPQDALIDLQKNETARKRLERFLRKEMRRLAQLYGDKVRAIAEMTWSFLHAADGWIRRPA